MGYSSWSMRFLYIFSWTSFSALSGMYVWTNEARLDACVRKGEKR